MDFTILAVVLLLCGGIPLRNWVNFFPRTQQTVTMSLVPIFIKPIAICRPVRLKSVQFRCFIPMIL